MPNDRKENWNHDAIFLGAVGWPDKTVIMFFGVTSEV